MPTKVHEILADQHNITTKQMDNLRVALNIQSGDPVPDGVLSAFAAVQIFNRRVGQWVHEDDTGLVLLTLASLVLQPGHWATANSGPETGKTSGPGGTVKEEDDYRAEDLGGRVNADVIASP
jgi:hypothetical protein